MTETIDGVLARHGATRTSKHGLWRIPVPDGCLTIGVRSYPVRTFIDVDRILCRDAPGDLAAEWLDEHVTPAVERYCKRARTGAYYSHGGGDYAFTNVLTSEAPGVLDEWLAQEIRWQTQVVAPS